ncbi:hypothetical protein AB0C96_37425, partial [Streptomyces sp. NPDC048506]|uniref:hypothetical protein n=1 Tax=Streptomyces sp. NPDC048506 TaxID=3155028 RepID=UPI003446C13B
ADVAPGGEVWDAADFKARLVAMHARGRGKPAFGVVKSQPVGIHDFELTGLTTTPVDCHVTRGQRPPDKRVLLCNLLWHAPAEWIAICHDQVQPHLLHGYSIGSDEPWGSDEAMLLFALSGDSTRVIDYGDVPRSAPLDPIALAKLLFELHGRSSAERAFDVKPVKRTGPSQPDLEITGLGPAPLHAVFKWGRPALPGETPLFKVLDEHLQRWLAVVAAPDLAGQTPLHVLDDRFSPETPGLRFRRPEPGTAVYPVK